MKRCCPLNVERAIVLGHGMLPVGFLAHLDKGNRISALLDVCDLSSRIFRRAIKHGDRNHRGQVVGESASEEEIEAAVLILSSRVNITFGMPWVDGGGIECRCQFRGSILFNGRKERIL